MTKNLKKRKIPFSFPILRFMHRLAVAGIIAFIWMRLASTLNAIKMSQRVAIIGAGPAGLVAAKSCIERGICPTIFEATNTIGGIWSTSNKRTWKSLHTNLSKYTCSFSDHQWQEDASLFPSQAEMNDYLVTYAEKHNIQPLIRFNSPVLKISKTELGKYYIISHDSSSATTAVPSTVREQKQEEFDQVIVASGYFSQPNHILNGILMDNPQMTVLSSEDYYHPKDFTNQTIVIIGGSFSGLEIVAELSKYAKKVYHVVPHPIYVLPKLIPQSFDDAATSFNALDLVFYQLNEKRLKAIESTLNEIKETGDAANLEVTIKPEEEVRQTHLYFQKMLGSHLLRRSGQNDKDDLFLRFPGERKSSYNDNEFLKSEAMKGMTFAGISDEYRSALHSNKIQLIAGRVTKIEKDQIFIKPSLSSTSLSSDSDQVVSLSELLRANQISDSDKIDTVISCTGFHPNVAFIESELLRKFDYSEGDSFQPFILYKDILHKEVEGLYFVGMYRGPFFGVMEQQARYVAGLISGQVSFPSENKHEKEIEISRQIREQSLRPQFPHNDYVGLLFDLAKESGLPLPSIETIESNRIITPFSFSTDQATANKVYDEIRENAQQSEQEGKYIPQVIISLLDGRRYSFDRQIVSRLDNSVTSVRGTISFHRIPSMPIPQDKIDEMCSTCSIKNSPTTSSSTTTTTKKSENNDVSDDDDDRVFLLYREQGILSLPNGQSFEVNQHYVYHYHKERNSLEIFFAKRDNVQVIDYHFLSLQFEKKEGQGWLGQNLHPCVKDLYNADYLFSFNALEIEKIQIDFHVKGPSKDYSSFTQLSLL